MWNLFQFYKFVKQKINFYLDVFVKLTMFHCWKCNTNRDFHNICFIKVFEMQCSFFYLLNIKSPAKISLFYLTLNNNRICVFLGGWREYLHYIYQILPPPCHVIIYKIRSNFRRSFYADIDKLCISVLFYSLYV